MKNIAVLMTCHNRVDKTLKCLSTLYNQSLHESVKFDVFLVDDGSADGTGKAVIEKYPEINVIYGDGNLFWNRGMHRAFGEALERDFDYYLWLNDDTFLFDDSIERMLETQKNQSQRNGVACIVAASTKDPKTGEFTYGGYRKTSNFNPLSLELVAPQEYPICCDTMCGNCVLIPKEVAEVVGNIDPEYRHRWGDVDYGFRARNNKFQVWIGAGFIADCEGNINADGWRDNTLSLKQRFNELHSLKGLGKNDWFRFVHIHGGVFWPIIWIRPYLRLIYDTFR